MDSSNKTDVCDKCRELMFTIRENMKFYEDTGNLEYLENAYRSTNELRGVLGNRVAMERKNLQ
jgi:hypothetical protein